MIEWRENVEGNRPTQMQYCLILEKMDEEEPGIKFADVGVAIYIPGGTIVPLALNEYVGEDYLTAEERLLRTIKYPDYWLANGGFYYESDEGDVCHINDRYITHWAELPELPDCYEGNTTDYMRNFWKAWPKDASKVRIVKIK